MDKFIDSIGFYQTNTRKYHEKIAACLDPHTQYLHWNLHESSYSLHDWMAEPEEHLDQLYMERAIELRNKYDYIILMLSGGVDSQNILKVFLNNNIKIDKVISWITTGTKNYKTNPSNVEIFKNTIPFLNNLKKKFTLPDYSIIDLKNIWPKMHDMSWMLRTSSGYVDPDQMCKSFFDEIDVIKKELDKGKKVAWIRGISKPYVDFYDSRWFVQFNDASAMGVHFPSFCGHVEKHFFNEWFYWGESCAKLICKQAHIIKKYFENNFRVQDFKNIHDLLKSLAAKTNSNINYFNNYYNRFINPLIYDLQTKKNIEIRENFESFTLQKVSNMNIEPKATVFFENYKTLADLWFTQGEKINRLLDKKYIINQGHFLNDGIINGWSKKYFIN